MGGLDQFLADQALDALMNLKLFVQVEIRRGCVHDTVDRNRSYLPNVIILMAPTLSFKPPVVLAPGVDWESPSAPE